MKRTCTLALGSLTALALLTVPGPGRGQDTDVLTKISTKTLESILGDLSIEHDKKAMRDRDGTPSRESFIYTFRRNDRPVALLFYGGRELMLQYRRDKLPYKTVNAWNEAAHFSRAYSVRNDALLEWNLDCVGGVTRDTVKQFVRRFDEDMTKFEEFVKDRRDEDPATVAEAGPRRKLPVQFRDGDGQKRIEVTFPLGKKDWQTAWKIEWDVEKRPVPKHLRTAFTQVKENVYFRIKDAWFRAGPTEKDEWIQVLEDARLSELFVPYGDGETRWRDVLDHGRLWKIMDEETECGPNGQVLGRDRVVVGETRDRGIIYKDVNGRARRGQSFVLWANLNAGNYNYLIQYGFQDDGTVTFHAGATGRNLHLGNQSKAEFPRMGHVHSACWRLGVRLGPEGQWGNTAYLVKHLETENGKGRAEQAAELFNGGNEGPAKWVPEEFTRLRVENEQVTVGRNRQPIAYELVPLRQGTARHYGARLSKEGARQTEEFTLHDFWVTRKDSEVADYTELPKYFTDLKKEGKEPRKVVATDLVLWYTSSILHDPRTEDGLASKHGEAPVGPALVAWSGFELRPRHVFASTPLFQPLPLKKKNAP